MLGHILDQRISVLEEELSLQLFLLQLVTEPTILLGFGAPFPCGRIDVGIVKTLRHLSSLQTLTQRFGIEKEGLQEVKPSCESFSIREIGRVIIV